MSKNIWVAAGDGDLARVQPEFARKIDNRNLHLALSPNLPDPFTYTPMHAAASYGHLHVLEYLVSRGGDVNITDSDGDTPLYTVENLETARFLVEHGATVSRQNLEGISPIDHLKEDFPEISEYLQSTLGDVTPAATNHVSNPSQHSQEAASEELTSALLSSVEDIMQKAEAEGRDPEEELRQAVSRAVLGGVMTGFELTTLDSGDRRSGEEDTPTKRARTD